MQTYDNTSLESLSSALKHALMDFRLDDAEDMYRRLCEMKPEIAAHPLLPTLISIQRGRVQEAMQALHEFPEDQYPELRALCLHALNDPTWQGLAENLEHDPNPAIRDAMRTLLGRPDF